MILSARYHKIYRNIRKQKLKKEQNAWQSLDSNAEHVRESWSGKHCAKNNVGKAISPRTTVFLAAKLDANIRSKSLTNHKQKYILLRKRTWQNTAWCQVENYYGECYPSGLLGREAKCGKAENFLACFSILLLTGLRMIKYILCSYDNE